ncbi:MAG TPA: hypothetical protein VIV11_20370 [Kofleriaceae bacterium]
MKLRWILILACVFVAPASAKKWGKQVRFAGIHPVAKVEGGGVCHIEFPHVHTYPANKLEYRVVADNNVFVGDPVAYGWDGPKHAYKGHHPVEVNVVAGVGDPYTHYCYLNGPHYHAFEPHGPDFKVVGDAYFYVGTPAPVYLEARPAYVGINAVYTPIVYTRPVVEVEAPSAWIMVRPGFVIEPAVVIDTHPGRHLGHHKHGHVHGGVGVAAGVSVHIPVPTVSVGVHVGGPVIHEHRHKRGKFKHKKWRRGR